MHARSLGGSHELATPSLRLARVLLVASTLAASTVGCEPAGESDAGVLDVRAVDAGSMAHSFTVVSTTTFVDSERTFPVSLVRVDRSDGGRTFVQYVGSDRAGPRGAVLMTLPYAVAGWTGEELDIRWAGYPLEDGLHPDVDGPSYDGERMAIFEQPSTDDVSEQGIVHLLNGLSVVFVFGRFYAGGDVRDEVADMQAGVAYLASRDDIDFSRVGVFGGSWGGFEALQASANAEPWRPLVTVALYPVIDLPSWVVHLESRTGLARDVTRSHLARVRSGTTEGFEGLRLEDLCGRLPERTLLLHDDLDNLAPIEAARRLERECGATLLRWPHADTPATDDPSHGPMLSEVPDVVVPSAFTYGNAYLHAALVRAFERVVGVVQQAALEAHLARVVDAQRRGEDVSWILPRLRDLLRVSYLELPSRVVVDGRTVVARAVQAAWGVATSPEDIETLLDGGVPPLP